MCVWHMHNNLKKQFPGSELKDKVWEATRSSNIHGFEKKMEQIKNMNEGAYKWLIEHTNKENWSRAFFEYHAKCDILVNNISECLNRVLLFAREKLLYGMLECIRMYMMDRFTTRRKFASRIQDCFGPKIRKKIEKLKEKTGECMVREAGDWIYQVNTKWNEQFVVDLRDRTCSCRRWMLTGIPCNHAIAAIETACETVDEFVDTCYSKESFQKVYEPIIYPVEGPDLWPKTTKPDVVPPEIIKLPGRPKGARKKSSEERREINNKKANTTKVKICELSHGVQKMSRSGMMSDYTCRKCGEKGHNKRKCPQLIPLESERVVEGSNPKDTQGSYLFYSKLTNLLAYTS